MAVPPPWRRRVLRQGPDQSRPLSRLCGALSRQERGRRGPRGSLLDPDRLCDRRRQAAFGLCRLHGTGQVADARLEKALRRGDGPHPARHPRASRPQPADLSRAPAPTAISAVRRSTMAASPGSAPISSRICARSPSKRVSPRATRWSGKSHSDRRASVDRRSRRTEIASPHPNRLVASKSLCG